MSSVRTVVVRLRSDIRDFEEGMSRASRTSKALAAGGLAGLAAGIAVVANESLKLDAAMRNVNSIAGQTDVALSRTTDSVIEMSKALPQSAVTLAEGLYDIASSGFQGAEGMAVLDAAAKSASAGMTETATSAKAITAVLNAYKLGASEAGDVSDILFSTVNLGVTSFEQLANNVGDYIGQAGALGVEFAETGSAIATLTLNGTTAAEAGTTLGSVLNTLIKPVEGLTEVFQQNGYATGSAAVEALGLRGVLELIRTSTGGTAEAMSALFPDVQALRGALALTSNEGAVYAEVAGKMEDKSARAGAAQKALAEQSKAASFQLGILKNQAMAAGLAAGQMVLPVVIDGLREVGELGASAGVGLRELGEVAGPTLANLASIGGDLWEVMQDLAAIAGPAAAGLGKLAVGGAVETLELLTDVLAPMVGFLADNEVAAVALAIALGVHLLGGVTALSGAIAGRLALAIYSATLTMAMAASSASAFAASLTLASLATAAATAGITLALASVAVGYQRASSAVDSLSESQKNADRAEGLTAQIDALDKLGDTADRVLVRIGDLQDRSLKKTLIDVPGNIEALKLLSSGTDDTARSAAEAAKQSQVFQAAVNRLAEAGFEPGSAAADRFHNNVVLSGRAFEDMVPILDKAGVVVGDSFETMSAKVDLYKAATEGAEGASALVVEALDGIASGAKTTEEAVADLKAAMDQLMGVFLTADEAAISFEAALDDMQESIAKTNGTLDINTAAGRENKSAIIETVQALRGKIEADAAAGASGDQLAGTLSRGRDRLIEQARAAGVPKAALEELLRTYNLTPELVQTVIAAVGATQAEQDVNGVKAAADRLNGTTATVRIMTRNTVIFDTVNRTSDVIARPDGTFRAGDNIMSANGNIIDFYAQGGMREKHVAQIAPAGAWRVWAEPETGGEAYIPLAANKRERSRDIWWETGQRLQMFSNGAVLTMPTGGSSAGPTDARRTTTIDRSTHVGVVYASDWQNAEAQLERKQRIGALSGG